jgi:hypothetical protein
VATLRQTGSRAVGRAVARDESGWCDPAAIEAHVQRLDDEGLQLRRRIRAIDGSAQVEVLVGLSDHRTWQTPAAFRRCVARAALKAAGIPERVVRSAKGQPQLEHFDGRSWSAMDLAAP